MKYPQKIILIICLILSFIAANDSTSLETRLEKLHQYEWKLDEAEGFHGASTMTVLYRDSNDVWTNGATAIVLSMRSSIETEELSTEERGFLNELRLVISTENVLIFRHYDSEIIRVPQVTAENIEIDSIFQDDFRFEQFKEQMNDNDSTVFFAVNGNKELYNSSLLTPFDLPYVVLASCDINGSYISVNLISHNSSSASWLRFIRADD